MGYISVMEIDFDEFCEFGQEKCVVKSQEQLDLAPVRM